MMLTNLAVIYYSATGTIHQLASAAAQAAADAGAEVRLRRVHELAPDEAVAVNPQWAAHQAATQAILEATHDDLRWADALLLGTPTRYGTVAAQLKQFIDTTGPLWMAGHLGDKIVGGLTSSGSAHGGQETTLLALYNIVHHWGSIIVPAGTTAAELQALGNPYGVSATARWDGSPLGEVELDAARAYGRRLVTIAERLRAPVAAA